MKWPGGDLQAVGELLDFRADLAKFVGQGFQPIGFFITNVSHVVNRRRPFREASNRRESHDAVANGVHINVSAIELPSSGTDPRGLNLPQDWYQAANATTHFFER